MIAIMKRVSQLVAKGMAMLLVAEFVIGVVQTYRVQPASEDLIIPEESAAARASPSEFCEIHVLPLGYNCEEYKVQTDDGFILVLHRLTNEGRQALPPAILDVSPQAVSSGDRKFNGQSQQIARNNLQRSINRRLSQLQESLTVAGTGVLERPIKDHRHRRAPNPRSSSKAYKHYAQGMRITRALTTDPQVLASTESGNSDTDNVSYQRRSKGLRHVLKHGTRRGYFQDLDIVESAQYPDVAEFDFSGPGLIPSPEPAVLETVNPNRNSPPLNRDVTEGIEPALLPTDNIDSTTLTSTTPISGSGPDPYNSIVSNSPLGSSPANPANSPTLRFSQAASTPSFEKFSPGGFSGKATLAPYPVLSLPTTSPVPVREYTPGSSSESSIVSSTAWSPAATLSPRGPRSSDLLTPQSTSFGNSPLPAPLYSSPLHNPNTYTDFRVPLSPALEPFSMFSSPITAPVSVRGDTPDGSSEASVFSSGWPPAATLSPRSSGPSRMLTPQLQSTSFAPLPAPPYSSPSRGPNTDLRIQLSPGSESYSMLSSPATSPVSLRGYTTDGPPEAATASSSAWSPATILSPQAPGPSDLSTLQSTFFAPLSTPPHLSPIGSPNTDLRIPFSPGPEPSMASFCNSEQTVILSPSSSDRNESDTGKQRFKASAHCRPVPVLLMHPEFLNGDNWFFRNSPTDQLLPLMLTDAGYDVWVGHHRATLWGHDHASLNPNNSRYWEWTWDEHAQYDIPALLGVIKNETGNHANHSIHYIGVSQSATAGAAAATNQSVAKLLKSMTLIGPTIYRGNTDSLVLSAWSYIADEIFYRQGYNGGGVFNYSGFHFPMNTISGQGPMSIALATITGPNCCLGSTVLESDNGWDGTTSIKNLIHFEQGVRRNTWQHFMYETDDDNMHAYEGEVFPPSYNPGDIPERLPIFVVYGEQDMVSPRDGVREFLSLLKGQPESLNLPQYAHFDLTYSVNRTEAVYTPILQFLKRW